MLAGAAVLAGLAIALSAGGGGHARHHNGAQRAVAGPPGELASAALYLGITRADLRRRLRGATLAEVAASIPGRSAAGLERTLLAAHEEQWRVQRVPPAEQAARAKRLRSRIREAVRRRRRAVGDLAVAAEYLGLDEAHVRSELLHGRSLASLAAAKPGRSRVGLIARLVAARRKAFEQALAARKITPAEQRTALAALHRRVEREVERTLKTP